MVNEMSTSINFHGVSEIRADSAGRSAEWLEVMAGDGSSVAIFMPYDVAAAMADAFNAQFETKESEAVNAE